MPTMVCEDPSYTRLARSEHGETILFRFSAPWKRYKSEAFRVLRGQRRRVCVSGRHVADRSLAVAAAAETGQHGPVSFELNRHPSFPGRPGPLLIVVMDGVGIGRGDAADAVALARTPTLDWLQGNSLYTPLRAHGTFVGMPSDDDMGNSEVGHNAMGAGRVYAQGAKRVGEAIASGDIFEGEAWNELVTSTKRDGGAMHFIGLLSDGNVHSHIDHLLAMLRRAKKDGLDRLLVHPLWDGRDVDERSCLVYLERLEEVLGEVGGQVASGGGRMKVTMDRYEADWGMVERGWNAHVHGKGQRYASAKQAVQTQRESDPSAIDQFLPEFVVVGEDGEPVGRIADGDAVVFFNFRGDRALEITRAFEAGEDFDAFDRGRVPKVRFAGMMEYDGDYHIPTRYLVSPPSIEKTMGEYLARNGVTQLAISETQKFGHVTYFWNGNRGGKFDDQSETYIEVPSDDRPFQERPWMQAAEITDRLVDELARREHRLARVNFPGGDMVGHTGHFEASVVAVEAIDLQLARLVKLVRRLEGTLVVTADHGNCEEMLQRDKHGGIARDEAGKPSAKTSHTLNPVPCLIYDPLMRDGELRLGGPDKGGLSNLAATWFALLGYEAPEHMDQGILVF